MKIRKSFLYLLGIMSLFVFTCKSNAEEMQTCPQGCFCIYDGKLPKRMSMGNICGKGVAQRMSCGDGNKVVSFAYAGVEGEVSCTRSKQAEYYFDEFSELYITNTGMYGFIGQDFITMPFFGTKGYGSEVGVYQCPSSYPVSQLGAKTIFECYKYDEQGNKVYYTKGKSQYMQNSLNNQEQVALSNSQIETTKAIIKSGISNSLIKKDEKLVEKNQKEKINDLKIQKTLTGKSMRASGNNRLGGNLEQPAISPSSNNSEGIDLETAKKMISAGI